MKIAVLSGKGGTGKTFVSVNLAVASGNSTYVDCDVEEPNGHLFLKPSQIETKIVKTKIPCFDMEKCISCKKCVDFCKFNALIMIKGKIKVFSDICHSCGGCKIVCPENAITLTDRSVGKIETGKHNKVKVVTGILNIGEASAVPVISNELDLIKNDDFTIIDCPPGSSCSVMESIKDTDYCLFVAESTAFGLHNLRMVYELSVLLKKPCGVVLNKYEYPYKPIEDFFTENNIPVIAKIPYNKEISEIISNGHILVEESERYKLIFSSVINQIKEVIK